MPPNPPTDKSRSEGTLFGTIKPGSLNVSKLFNVSGWVTIVTGGGTGLGLVTANALADNGAKVYITGRRMEPLQKAAREADEKAGTGAIIPVQADMSNKEGIKAFKEHIEREEKYINVLINNHGIVPPSKPVLNQSGDDYASVGKYMFENESFDNWLNVYTINTASYYFTSFAFLELLGNAKTIGGYPEPGNIVNIASMSGITKTSQNGQFNYNAGKAATISLSHQLATELARKDLGVRVNVVCPGYFPSGMTIINPEKASGSAEEFKEYRKEWAIPFGRPGNAIDYSQGIFGLIVNQYVTATELVIDGGWLLESAF